MECYIGTILLFAGKYAPKDFALCNGDLLEISKNQALYSVIEKHYGGNNTCFNLPKLQAPNENMVYIICTNGLYPVRD